MCYYFHLKYNQIQLCFGPVLTMHLLFKDYLRNGESVIATRRSFCCLFMLRWNDALPSRILRQVSFIITDKNEDKTLNYSEVNNDVISF